MRNRKGFISPGYHFFDNLPIRRTSQSFPASSTAKHTKAPSSERRALWIHMTIIQLYSTSINWRYCSIIVPRSGSINSGAPSDSADLTLRTVLEPHSSLTFSTDRSLTSGITNKKKRAPTQLFPVLDSLLMSPTHSILVILGVKLDFERHAQILNVCKQHGPLQEFHLKSNPLSNHWNCNSNRETPDLPRRNRRHSHLQ